MSIMPPLESRSEYLCHVDVRRWADRNTVLDVQVALEALPRLLAILDPQATVSSCVFMKAVFSLDPAKNVLLSLVYSGQVSLVCQRCMEAFVLPFAEEVLLQVVKDERTLFSSSQQNEYVLTDAEGYLNLLDVLEDELMLTMPLVARHEDGGCGDWEPCAQSAGSLSVVSEMESATHTDKVMPFAVLSQLLGEKNR